MGRIALATATPNKRYRWHASIRDLILRAELVNGKVFYYETNVDHVRVREETIQALFPKGRAVKDQPFLERENRDFYAVLKRKKRRYREAYQQLLKSKAPITPTIRRTKFREERKKLKNIQPQFQDEINEVIADLLKNSNYPRWEIIRGYVADTLRGRSYQDGQFTVPYWAYKDKRKGYFIYYVAHELSHQISDKLTGRSRGRMHDEEFYKVFADICPEKYQHYELGYKPSSAKYGIGKRTKSRRTR